MTSLGIPCSPGSQLGGNPVDFVSKSSLLQQIRLRNGDSPHSTENDGRHKSRSRETFGPQSTFQNDYPTFKLDRGAVVDNSIKFERYNYPSEGHASNQRQIPKSSSNSSNNSTNLLNSNLRNVTDEKDRFPPPPPEMAHQAHISNRGTRTRF